MKKWIERKEYLDKLLSYKDKDIIKVVTGLRRSGKSTPASFPQSKAGIIHKNVFQWLLEKEL